MGFGQLAGIPNWFKNKLDELSGRIETLETDIDELNHNLIKIKTINFELPSTEVNKGGIVSISTGLQSTNEIASITVINKKRSMLLTIDSYDYSTINIDYYNSGSNAEDAFTANVLISYK